MPFLFLKITDFLWLGKKKRWMKALSPVYTVFLVIIFTIFVDIYCFLVSISGYGRLGEWHVWIFQDSDLTRISGIKKTHGQNHTNSRDYANRYMYFLEIDTRKQIMIQLYNFLWTELLWFFSSMLYIVYYFLHYIPAILVHRFRFALFWEWYEHNSSAQGTVPSKPNRGAASAVCGSTRWVESELADHFTVRQVPVFHQWHSVGVRWTPWTHESTKWSEWKRWKCETE